MTDPDILPEDADAAAQRLRQAHVPAPILACVRQLQQAGHAAVLVGGAVRDALRGQAAEDWDVATSATPDEVIATFRRTIPTGMEHGTVTVLMPGDGKPEPVEVTTFRGEGAYADGRRPDSVVFLRDLVEDLARRDLTINALAWDPITETFTDPFGGLDDLRAGLVRAVGEPLRRFTEDGLRTMRAVRMCATMRLRLEPETAAAIPHALHVLAKVSRERVRVELWKMLGAPQPSLGLWPMRVTGIWPHVLPALSDDEADAAIEAVDAMPADPGLRAARLLWPHRRARATVEEAVDALKPSKAQRQRILAAIGTAADDLLAASDPVAMRKAAALLGRPHIDDALAVGGASAQQTAAVMAACDGAPLSVGELAISGGELIAEGVVAKGPAVGDCMRTLLGLVLEDPSRNTRAALLDAARG